MADSDAMCYISECPNRKTHKHKACSQHKWIIRAIVCQATQAGKKADVEKLLSDPVQASQLVHEFMQHVKPGVRTIVQEA